MSKAEGVLFINVANYTMIQNSANVLVLESANNSVTLPQISTQNSIIFIVNAGTTPSIIQSSNLTTVLTLQTSQSCILCPLIAGAGNATGSWIVLGFFPNNSGIIPSNSWNLSGNSGLASTGVLGTTDTFDTWKIVEGGNTVMNLINQGEINIPNVNIMSFGNRGTAESTIIIKQFQPTSTTPLLGQLGAMQMISASDNNSYYWGVDSSDDFNIYSFISPSTYKKLMTFLPNGQVLMNNQNLSGLLNPVNPQDAATKNYSDMIMSMLIPTIPSSGSGVGSFNVSTVGGGGNPNNVFANNGTFWSTGSTTSTLIADANQGETFYVGAIALQQTSTGPGAGSTITVNIRNGGVDGAIMYTGSFVTGYFHFTTPAIGNGIKITFNNTVGATNINFMQYYGHYT